MREGGRSRNLRQLGERKGFVQSATGRTLGILLFFSRAQRIDDSDANFLLRLSGLVQAALLRHRGVDDDIQHQTRLSRLVDRLAENSAQDHDRPLLVSLLLIGDGDLFVVTDIDEHLSR